MSANDLHVDRIIAGIPGRKVPMPAAAAGFLGMALGVVGVGYGFAMGETAWTWGAILVGLVYTMNLAMGGVMFSVILTLTKAHWGRPLKRLAEVFGLFLPVAYLMLLVFLLFGNGLYAWNPTPFEGIPAQDIAPHGTFAWSTKPFWLSKWTFIGRQAVAMLVLFGLGLAYIRTSLVPDLVQAKAQLGDKAPALWNALIGGKTNVAAAVESSKKTQQVLGGILAWSYALLFSLMAFDLLMSLSPWWFSNMFGAWHGVSSVWVTMAWLGIVALLGGEWLGIRHLITKKLTHDLGMLCLAGCMFWAYTSYAQLLPIYYANMPEETDYLLVRLMLPQWSWLARTVGVMCFVIPFTILLSRGIKKMKWPFIGVLSIIAVGIFLERTLVVMPSVYFGDEFPVLNFVIISLGVWFGFLGLFFTVVTQALAKLPPVTTSDECLAPHPWDVHVHSLDAHH